MKHGRRAAPPWATGLLALFLAACVVAEPVYEGERKSRGEVAIVTGLSSPGLLKGGVTARIEAVDGQRIEGGATKVELLPGRHEFVLQCTMKELSGTVTTTAELRAGGTYVVAVGLGPDGEPDALIFEK